jgi:transcriptional regulator with XRE-family HTH domain
MIAAAGRYCILRQKRVTSPGARQVSTLTNNQVHNMSESEQDDQVTFGETLEQLMLRRGLWDTAVATRIGVTRSEVYRWRTGRTVPSRRSLERLRSGLQLSAQGQSTTLTPSEWERLLALSGHAAPIPSFLPRTRDRADLSDRCVVYAYQYERRSFPSGWSRRALEIEREIHGGMRGSLHRPPTFLRPESVSRLYSRWYDEDLVEQYVAELRERRERWEQRVEEYEILQLYSKQMMAEYVRTRRWQGIELSPEQLREQVDILLTMLDRHYPNFSVGLDDEILPYDATIIGQEVVLLTLRQRPSINVAGWTIFGMEMSGLPVVRTFSQGFDRMWGRRTVMRDPAAIRAWFESIL